VGSADGFGCPHFGHPHQLVEAVARSWALRRLALQLSVAQMVANRSRHLGQGPSTRGAANTLSSRRNEKGARVGRPSRTALYVATSRSGGR